MGCKCSQPLQCMRRAWYLVVGHEISDALFPASRCRHNRQRKSNCQQSKAWINKVGKRGGTAAGGKRGKLSGGGRRHCTCHCHTGQWQVGPALSDRALPSSGSQELGASRARPPQRTCLPANSLHDRPSTLHAPSEIARSGRSSAQALMAPAALLNKQALPSTPRLR